MVLETPGKKNGVQGDTIQYSSAAERKNMLMTVHFAQVLRTRLLVTFRN